MGQWKSCGVYGKAFDVGLCGIIHLPDMIYLLDRCLS